MGRINRANIKKAWHYLKRNGFRSALWAAGERLAEGKAEYIYREPGPEILAEQRRRRWEDPVLFSIVVPAYRTPPGYLREMMESVLEQTYESWELIIADASEDDGVEAQAGASGDPRIRYVRLGENRGISENTNSALELVKGDYTGLLDHDDVLAPDALFEMARRIEEGSRDGKRPMLLYSDEDKCDRERTSYFDPHRKEKFNLDLLLSNNYICHFLVMESGLMRRLGMRKEYDGAQDFDLALRAAGELMEQEDRIVHVPLVLYHWRCHTGSTAANPQSKRYAYEAGLRAVQNFADARGWAAEAYELKHLGFYGLRYRPDLLSARGDVGAEGGRLLRGGRVAGGMYREDGAPAYAGLPAGFSGYMHRAALRQDAAALDIRCIRVRPECRPLFEVLTGVPYRETAEGGWFDFRALPEETDWREVSLRVGTALREKGYRLVWSPESKRRLRG